MRYYKRIDEGRHIGTNWGGDPTYWLEVNERGDADRELQVYPNGNVLRYDRNHPRDSYGALAEMVVDGGEEEWMAYEISPDDFEEQWRTLVPVNCAPA